MPMNELVELKKQIAESKLKDLSTPVHPREESRFYLWRRKMGPSGCVWITIL
jgi:hypothetical protein